MKVLIIYGTIEGQTRKIARYMEEVLQRDNHSVMIANAIEEPPTPDGFDLVIIGSSIHMHKFNHAVKNYIEMNLGALSNKSSVFFSVCMATASDIPEEHQEVDKLTNAFLDKLGWKPHGTWHFAGALKYTQYDYFKKLIMRMIAKKQGGATDTGHDHEYTDWTKVESTVKNFVQGLG